MPKKLPAEIEPVLQMFPDLLDPADADLKYPMYSPWAVGMPLPGSDFCELASLRSAEPIPKKLTREGVKKNSMFDKWLKALYRAALYKFPYSMLVRLKNQSHGTARFVPGCLWGESARDLGFAGPTKARVMVIGKFPGWEEANTGTNFSGVTSQELVKALDELGIGPEERETWYTTNIVKFPSLDPKAATLSASWVKNCLPILHQEIRLVRPSYILLLGDDAIKAVLNRASNVSNTSGQVFDMRIPLHEFDEEEATWHDVKIMTATHPARIARQPDMYPIFLGAVRQFVKLLNGESVGDKETDLEHYELYDEDMVEQWVNMVMAEKATMFALDCEWHGSYPTNAGSYLRTIQIGWGHKKAAAIILRNCNGERFKGDWLPHLKRLLKNTEDRKVRIVGHQFRADLPWLLHHGLDLRPEFEVPEDDPNPDGVTRLYGWQKTKTEGGIDTLLAIHAWQETHPLGLEACTSQLVGVPRYDIPLEEWKNKYCKDNKLKKSDLEGYGACPDEILNPYGLYDADATWRLADYINKPGGLLDRDRFGNNSRKAFWIAMRASPAFLEIETTGVAIDRKRAEKLTDLYIEVRDTRLKELKEKIKWPEFNPASPRHRVELMFGEKFHAKKGLKLRPEGAVTLDLSPVKSTGKRSVMWKDALAKKFSDPTVMENFNPATDKETMGILASSEKNTWQIDVVKSLRDVSFLNQLLRTVLRPPSYTDQDDEVPELDESGDKVYEKGILSELHDDGRVRPHFLQAAETGRARCSKPNLQNWSKRREPDYMRIAGDKYKYPLRSIIVPAPGCVFIEADYSAAEVAGVAWMSGDPQLIEHARRSALPEDHPDYFDIHSNIAVRAFQLNCLPTKKGLKSIDKIALRTAAKAVFFGYLYGQGAESAARKAREEGADVTTQDAQALIDSLNSTYPLLAEFFDECRSRAIDPGWLRNCFGRYRRFSETFDRQVIGESQRQAMNFP